MCRGIIGFRLSIDSVQAQFKLSQNKMVENIEGVIKGLKKLKTNDAVDNGCQNRQSEQWLICFTYSR